MSSDETLIYLVGFTVYLVITTIFGLLAVLLYSRNQPLPNELNWLAGLSSAARAVKEVLLQTERPTTLLIIALTVIEVIIYFNSLPESLLSKVEAAASLFWMVLAVRIVWSTICTTVRQVAPELADGCAGFITSILRLLCITININVCTILGWFLFVVPGILAYLYLSMAFASCVVSSNGLDQGCRESAALVRRNFKLAAKFLLPLAIMIFGIPALLFLSEILINMVFYFDLVKVDASVALEISGAVLNFLVPIINIVCMSLMAALSTRLYLFLTIENNSTHSEVAPAS